MVSIFFCSWILVSFSLTHEFERDVKWIRTLEVNVKQQTCFEYVYVACSSNEGANTGIFYTKCSTLVGYRTNQKKVVW